MDTWRPCRTGQVLWMACCFGFLPVLRADNAVRRTEDIVYGRKAGLALTLDLFQPENANGAGQMFLVKVAQFIGKGIIKLKNSR